MQQIVPQSPAKNAGLRWGDIIVEFNGAAVTSANGLRKLVSCTQGGVSVPVVVLRDGERISFPVTVGAHPKEIPASQ